MIEALETEIQKLQDTPPDPNELHRALKQARALFAYGSERITNQAFWLGFSAMIADHSWYENYLDRLGAVTPEDVQRVAREYLRPQNRVLGIYRPVSGQPESEPGSARK